MLAGERETKRVAERGGEKRARGLEGSSLRTYYQQRVCFDMVSFPQREIQLSGEVPNEPSKSSLRMRREGSSGRSNLGRAMSVNKSNDQIAQSGQDLWSISGAKAGAIFQKGDITHIMRPIFDAPMSPNQFE